MRKKILPVIGMLFLASCASNEIADSKKVDQNSIHMHYIADYNLQTRKMDCWATFRFGGSNGTTLVLSAPSYVKVNGEDLEETRNIFGGAAYAKTVDMKAGSREVNFEFSDTKKKVYTNKTNLPVLGSIQVPTTCEIGKELVIIWTNPLKENEFVEITVVQDGSMVIESNSTQGQTRISFLLKQEELNPGTARISVRHGIATDLKEATEEGGSMSIQVIYPEYSIQLDKKASAQANPAPQMLFRAGEIQEEKLAV